jgi:ATP-dependent RNA helicase DeaD
MEEFEKTGLNSEILKILEKKGISCPTEIQAKSLPSSLKGRDVIGSSATGSGKTLAFSCPIIEKLEPANKVRALILTPTRELAEQVSTAFSEFASYKKLKVLSIYGGVSIENQIRKLSTADVVVGTPGRILDHLNRRTLDLKDIEFLVLDEVDRMLDMGFRDDVEKIISQCPKKRQTLLFSATLDGGIEQLAKKYTNDAMVVSVESHVDPSKLTQVYYDVPDYKKFSLLVHLLKNENSHLVMVFCNTRRNVDFVAKNLKLSDVKVRAIHGGLTQAKRNQMLEDFTDTKVGVLVCTDVAARGLDISGVSHVYNYDIPASRDDYIHRIGRTARAGKEGKAINILASRDYDNFRSIGVLREFDIKEEKIPEGMEEVRVQREEYRGRPSRRGGRPDSRRGGSSRSSYGGRSSPRGSSGPRRDSSRGSSSSGGSARGSSYSRRGDGSSRTSGSDSRREGGSRGRGRSSSSRDGFRGSRGGRRSSDSRSRR